MTVKKDPKRQLLGKIAKARGNRHVVACAVVLVVGGGNEGKCETFGKRLALTGCPLDGSVHSVVIHIVSFLPVVPIGQPVM